MKRPLLAWVLTLAVLLFSLTWWGNGNADAGITKKYLDSVGGVIDASQVPRCSKGEYLRVGVASLNPLPTDPAERENRKAELLKNDGSYVNKRFTTVQKERERLGMPGLELCIVSATKYSEKSGRLGTGLLPIDEIVLVGMDKDGRERVLMILRCGNTVENKLYLPAIRSAKVQEEPPVQKVETASVPTATRVSAPICTPYDMTEECLARIQEAPRQEVRYTQGTLHADELPSDEECFTAEAFYDVGHGLGTGIVGAITPFPYNLVAAPVAYLIAELIKEPAVKKLSFGEPLKTNKWCRWGATAFGTAVGVVGGRSIHTSTTSPTTTTTSGGGGGPANPSGGGPANQGN